MEEVEELITDKRILDDELEEVREVELHLLRVKNEVQKF